jgi:hypothetical protein
LPLDDRDDLVAIGGALEALEVLAEQVAQLGLARQPHHRVLLDAVERPLGGAVEADHLAGRVLVDVDRHVAEDEDVLVHVAVGDDEAVARRRRPVNAGGTQRPGQLEGDHRPSVPVAARAAASGSRLGPLRHQTGSPAWYAPSTSRSAGANWPMLSAARSGAG